MNSEVKPKKIIIKKYENRRLYDTARSQYVNLDEVAQLVREGNEIQVLDAATGEDLTRLVLTQIIMEHAKSPQWVFPLGVLRQMVVASGRATQESALKYIQAAVDMYQTAFQAMAPGLNPFDFINRAQESRVATPEQAGDPKSAVIEGPRPQSGPAPDSVGVAELRKRLEQLEALVSKPTSQSELKRSPKHRRKR
jgi:polyhydroxyalkanoate synthesis repressor PhaR